jgi:hypothetical protein
MNLTSLLFWRSAPSRCVLQQSVQALHQHLTYTPMTSMTDPVVWQQLQVLRTKYLELIWNDGSVEKIENYIDMKYKTT